MKRILILIMVFFSALTLLGCNSNAFFLSDTTGKYIVKDKTSIELKNRIDSIYESNSASGKIEIKNDYKSVFYYKGSIINNVYFSFSETKDYYTDQLYYYYTYSDNKSEELSELVLQRDGELLKNMFTSNTMQTSLLANNYDSYIDEAEDPFSYYNLFFKTLSYEKIDENKYIMECSYKDLVEDPGYKALFNELKFPSSISDKYIGVSVEFDLNETGLECNILFTILLDSSISSFFDGSTNAYKVTLELKSKLSFPSDMNIIDFKPQDYYLPASQTDSDAIIKYNYTDPIKVITTAQTESVIKVHFVPGFYTYQAIVLSGYQDDISGSPYLTNNDELNINSSPCLYVEQEGDYYFHFETNSSNKHIIKLIHNDACPSE